MISAISLFKEHLIFNCILFIIYDKAFPDTSVATFTEASAASYLEPLGFASKGKVNDDGLLGRTVVASANATNSPRNFCAILKDFKETGKRKYLFVAKEIK